MCGGMARRQGAGRATNLLITHPCRDGFATGYPGYHSAVCGKPAFAFHR